MGPTVLFVEDVERAKTFYRDVLGFELQFEDPTSAAMVLGSSMLIAVHVDSAAEMVAGSPIGAPSTSPRSAMFCIFVDDVDAWHARMTAQGVVFAVGPMDREWGRRTAHFMDPDGHLWEISKEL